MMPEENGHKPPMSVEEEIIKEEENAKSFIFFDFECTQYNLVQCDKGNSPDVFGKCRECLKSEVMSISQIFVWCRRCTRKGNNTLDEIR